MVFTPKFSAAKGIEPVLDNVETIVRRDIVEALEWANGGPGLAPFEQYNNWDLTTVKFPTFTIEPADIQNRESSDGNILDRTYNFTITIEIEGPEPKQLTKDVLKYTQAVTMILLSASDEDLFQGCGRTDGWWTVDTELFARAGVNENNSYYGRGARINLAVRYAEVANG